MTKLMLDAFGGDQRDAKVRRARGKGDLRIECFHVDARLSSGLDDIGRVRFQKVFLIVRYALEAIWCRWRYGVSTMYYVPAPGQRAPLYRDWIVMALCRPFFSRLIFHTHAVGVGTWLEEQARPWERWISKRLLGGADLNIALSEYYRAEVMKLCPKRVEIVPIGIPDPCPEFEKRVLPRRRARVAARAVLLRGQAVCEPEAGEDPDVFRVLFLSMCHRDKGLFDALEAVALLHQGLLKENLLIQVHFDVVGKFFEAKDRQAFDARIAQPDLQTSQGPVVKYHGFVDTETKYRLLRESDCFCFPTYYEAEGQPASLVEAMAFGLPVVTTRWRAIPDLFEEGYPGLVDIKSPRQLVEKFELFLREYGAETFRGSFLGRFTEQRYMSSLKEVLQRFG